MAIPVGITSFPVYGNNLPIHAYTPPDKRASSARDAEVSKRKLFSTPTHLSRAIYIPYHNCNTTHLPLYDVSEAYERSIGNAPVGGSEFKTRLCLMKKPSHNTLDVDVQFLVNVEQGSGRATIGERRMGDGVEVSMVLPDEFEEDFRMATTPNVDHYTVTTTYPLPERCTKKKSFSYPYFAITSTDEKRTFEWQVYPDTLGKLGYVLVDSTVESEQPDILAIYHHAGGIESEMPTNYAEGMLLLPGRCLRFDNTVIVASLFGLLWKIRATGRGGTRKSKLTRLGEVLRSMRR